MLSKIISETDFIYKLTSTNYIKSLFGVTTLCT